MPTNPTQFLKIETPITYMGNTETEPAIHVPINLILKGDDVQFPLICTGHRDNGSFYWKGLDNDVVFTAIVGDMWFPLIRRA